MKKTLSELLLISIVLAGTLLIINAVFGKRSFFSSPLKTETAMPHKRSDFKLTSEDYTKFLQRELTRFQGYLAGEVQYKRMSRTEASRRYMMLEDMLELMKLAQLQGLNYQDLKAILENQEIRPQSKQQGLFKKSQFPN